MPEQTERKRLIVVSMAFNRHLGSEPGKGYHWTTALSRIYDVHLIHAPEARFDFEDANLSAVHRWPTEKGVSSWQGLGGYVEYYRWCGAVFKKCQMLLKQFPIAGLHHVTIGSFRLLPRYDRLGIPYSLGPLGGGEYTPKEILPDCGLPFKERLTERIRPIINRACVLQPGISSVLKSAKRVIATTEETAELLRIGGAGDVIVRFPDVFEPTARLDDIVLRRSGQCAEISREMRIVWSGRGLWWKGGQIAIEFVRRLKAVGLPAHLHIYSNGPCIPIIRQKVSDASLDSNVTFHAPVPREELLQIYLDSHLFVYPTLHDSSSSAIPEAYGTGLPSMTLGIGGVEVASSQNAGLNKRFPVLEDWFGAGVAMIRSWQENPQLWLEASRSALQKSADFSFSRLHSTVECDLSIY